VLVFLAVAMIVLVAWTRLVPHSVKTAAASAVPLPTATATIEAVPTVVPTIAPVVRPGVTPVTVAPVPTVAPTATASPSPTAAYTYATSWLEEHPAINPPKLTGKSAIIVDYDTRRVLYTLDAHARRAQASTTKITTADIALDLAGYDKMIKVTQEAIDTEPDHMGLKLNEELRLEDLIYGLILNSGNDAAYAITDGLGGTGPFVQKMNDRATQLGLRDTHFANPAGFDDPQHYSSAYDLVILTTDAVTRHPELKVVFATKKWIVESTKTHGWFGPINFNNLLWDYPGAWGVKPGLTDNADYCLVAAATRDGHTIVTVEMGVPTNRHFDEGSALLDYGFKRIAEK